MKQRALDETQKMKPLAPAQLDDTQSLPSVSEDMLQEAADASARRHRGVRELPPLPMEAEETMEAGQVRSHSIPAGQPSQRAAKAGSTKRRAVILVCGFLAALFLGFLVAGYHQQNADRAANEQAHQEQQLADKQAKIAAEMEALEEQKAQLEEEKRTLEQQKQQAREAAARAQGRSEQIESEKSSGVRGLLDKVTGKEQERQAQKAESDSAAKSAQQDATEIDKSLENAQQMLDDVNAKLDTAKSVQQEARTALSQAKTAYDENRDTVDTVLSYVQTGAATLASFLLP